MSNQKRFLRFNLATIVSVYFLILVGGLVRSQDAGMGCPDWPKCFGEYIPPTSSVNLPVNYQEIFLEQRLEKNGRLVDLLRNIGLNDLAESIASDPNIRNTHPFSARKAWTEYINRLIGVAIGLFVIGNMIFGFLLSNSTTRVKIIGVLIFLITLFQGWIGSLVVSTNLLTGFISFHMFLAIIMVVMLLWMRVKVQEQENWMVTKNLKWVLGIFAFLLVPQIILGTLTREQVDLLLDNGLNRELIAQSLIGSFIIHRSYSWLLLGLGILSFFMLRKNGFLHWPNGIAGLVFLEIILGIVLVYGGMPALVQPFHLLIGILLFGGVFYLLLRVETVEN